jgi:cytochrome c
MSTRIAVVVAGSVLLGIAGTASAQAVDAAAAEALAKKSGCLKCHSITQKKDGPSYKSVAEKYKGKPDAEQKLYTHLTTHPKVKVDGQEEEHDSLKTKNDAEIRNVIRWILSR